MINTIFCATFYENGAKIVEVEGGFARGLPSFNITGLVSHSIQEAKHRVQSALSHFDIKLPPMKFTLNLSPSDLPKSGTHFDLPIALLGALHKQSLQEEWFAFGELGLDGSLKHQDNIYPLLLQIALERPNAKVILPSGGEEVFAFIPSLNLYFAKNLNEALQMITMQEGVPYQRLEVSYPFVEVNQNHYYYLQDFELDFVDVLGQEVAKRASLIAVSGFHNIIFEGSPGCGKSMIAKRMRYLLPPMSLEEMIECAKVQSMGGQSVSYSPLRPFREPHQSASKSSILGSVSKLQAKPGEIALAHHGLLFLDELPHFKKDILEALREPLENQTLVVSRVQSKIKYSTSFLFVGALNPCPCGNLLSTSKSCRCQEREISAYRNRLSEPFLDRIDLFVQMSELKEQSVGMNSKQMQEQMFGAFIAQKKRGQTEFNGKLNEKEIAEFCQLDKECQDLLKRACERFALSYRGANKIKKVARTIADLDGSEQIQKSHLLEAFSYRKLS
ncbi:Fis family transcriptional regulator [Helicobacter enhydrae]|uniref:Fis family transcriptional regulator n=1 Tax=Helicobacter enhydrae TaxID=222136 RepID=A0A1B1U5V4_9HELI|nr:YifB family Mg chelatase-like AAA ATPase [Helicobacter enhydrae]ANV98136.1 Fis family transcriptional regulator [Helicobacter enhydrae]